MNRLFYQRLASSPAAAVIDPRCGALPSFNGGRTRLYGRLERVLLLPPSQDGMIATKADNGREMTASGMLRIELQQAGAAGYAWEIQDLDTAHFQVLEAGATDRSVSQKNFFGAPIGVRWVLRDKRVGSAHLRLLHYRPWEGK